MVMAMMKPIAPLSQTDHMIDLGSVRLASSTSSAGLKIRGFANQAKDVIRTHMDRTIKSAQGAHRREESDHSYAGFGVSIAFRGRMTPKLLYRRDLS